MLITLVQKAAKSPKPNVLRQIAKKKFAPTAKRVPTSVRLQNVPIVNATRLLALKKK